MTDPVLTEIMEMCLGLEQKAGKVYETFAGLESQRVLKAFWGQAAADEARHAKYWMEALILASSVDLPQILDDPAGTKRELRALWGVMDEMLAASPSMTTVNEALGMAGRMEFTMLHPSFAILFHFVRGAPGKPNPEDDYDVHLRGFAEVFAKYGESSLSWKLLGDLIQAMWRENRRLAGKLREIHVLRELLPICASCKKIRDDQGDWHQLENYLEQHADVTFTHGLCPDCAARLYPEQEGSE